MTNKGKTNDKEQHPPETQQVSHESPTHKANQDHRQANPDKDKAMLEKGQSSRR